MDMCILEILRCAQNDDSCYLDYTDSKNAIAPKWPAP